MASQVKGLHNKNNVKVNQLAQPPNEVMIDLDVEKNISNAIFESSSTHYQNLFQLAPIAFFTINESGLITDANHAAADLMGIQQLMLISHCLSRYVAPQYLNNYQEFRTALRTNTGPHYCELKLMKRNGPLFYATLHGQIIDSTPTCLLILTNIRSHKQDMVANESIDATNAMNTTLISQLNNSLGVLSNYLSGCVRRLEAENPNLPEIHSALIQSSQHINRISQYLLRMRNLFYNDNVELRAVCLHDMLSEAIRLINEENLNSRIKILYRKNTNISSIQVDKLYMLHVFLNVMRNAFDALRDAEIVDPALTIQVNQPDEKTVEISFIDNGPGFELGALHKLFNPTYTTKPYGLGLGLAVSKMIVESHGGKLSGELNLTYGSCFKLTLPLICN